MTTDPRVPFRISHGAKSPGPPAYRERYRGWMIETFLRGNTRRATAEEAGTRRYLATAWQQGVTSQLTVEQAKRLVDGLLGPPPDAA